MNTTTTRLAGAWARLRRSMAAQIALSIGVVSIVIIAGSGYMLDRTLAGELRAENELTLLANLAFIRDDLAAADYDVADAAPRIVNRTERGAHRLHAAIFDAQRQPIAVPPKFPIPIDALPRDSIASDDLPAELSLMQIEDMSDRIGTLTTLWKGPDGRPYRMLLGRIALPRSAGAAGAVGEAGSILVALAIEPTETLELRKRDRHNVVIALSAAALLAVLLGAWIARRIVVAAKRLGTAASRISAQALHERLQLDDTPTELLDSAIAFNRMLDRLQQSFERLSAFSSDLAHDFRTPIGNLLGEAQVALSRSRSADDYRAVLESAVEEYERLSRMIGNMLFLARAENEQAVVSATFIETRVVLDRVIAYFEQIAEDRGIALRATSHASPGALEQLWADETMTIRALGNLVSNALRHAPRGTEVELAAAIDSEQGCAIEVSNDGPPIPPEQQARIFERFFRGEASREGSASSSGLGLAIVSSIMALHRGTVSVRSEPGERTVFRLEFPPPALHTAT
ncbi:MAG: heavy metal sensor histidine kinase [Caldimonas sp.]